MQTVLSVLEELGFRETNDPHQKEAQADNHTMVVCFDPLPDLKKMEGKVFGKGRGENLPDFLAHSVPMVVVVDKKKVFVQTCQLCSIKDDPRLEEGGLIWFNETFTDEDDAVAYIRKASESFRGVLYGPSFPEPE